MAKLNTPSYNHLIPREHIIRAIQELYQYVGNIDTSGGGGGGITTETDPVFTASVAHGITSNDISNWNSKQNTISDLDTIRSGAAAGATAVQPAALNTALAGKEDVANKVTSLSASSTDTQYPSAKCVYDLVGNIETLLSSI